MYEYESLLARITKAILVGDSETIGVMATRSAQLNQSLQPKRLLDDVVKISRGCGALGVAVAHSGTTIGVLLADDDPDHAVKLNRVVAACRAFGRPVSLDSTLSFGGAKPSTLSLG
jgi:uncharacterized protein involved in propanediol utilization